MNTGKNFFSLLGQFLSGHCVPDKSLMINNMNMTVLKWCCNSESQKHDLLRHEKVSAGK